eukprot:GHVP01012478.1.p3 GENE.GHVP01012478.1~~GHVP01012478.1.p3  ORF type:complete len:111 (+),score=28.40 GHVP01012478.1:1054-1386(+)
MDYFAALTVHRNIQAMSFSEVFSPGFEHLEDFHDFGAPDFEVTENCVSDTNNAKPAFDAAKHPETIKFTAKKYEEEALEMWKFLGGFLIASAGLLFVTKFLSNRYDLRCE